MSRVEGTRRRVLEQTWHFEEYGKVSADAEHALDAYEAAIREEAIAPYLAVVEAARKLRDFSGFDIEEWNERYGSYFDTSEDALCRVLDDALAALPESGEGRAAQR